MVIVLHTCVEDQINGQNNVEIVKYTSMYVYRFIIFPCGKDLLEAFRANALCYIVI